MYVENARRAWKIVADQILKFYEEALASREKETS